MKVTMRPATKLPKIIIHRKVAAYCRVSTQQEIQHHSLEAQRYCAYTDSCGFTILRIALPQLWTLPRTTKQSTGLFCTLPSVRPSFRVPPGY